MKFIGTHLFCWILMLHVYSIFGQEVIQPGSVSNSTEKIIQATEELNQSFKNKDMSTTAAAYEKIGNEYFAKKEYGKAETNYLKAQEIYQQLGKKKDIARVSRQLGKVQEALNKIPQAMENFKQAADNSSQPAKNDDKVKPEMDHNQPNIASEDISSPTNTGEIAFDDYALNYNDFNRLKNEKNLAVQEGFFKSNIALLENKAEKPELQLELIDQYSQLGDVQLSQNKLPEAIYNYTNAYESAGVSNPQGLVNYGNKLSNAYTIAGKYDDAIKVQKDILAQKTIQENPALKINQIQHLAEILVKKDDTEEALALYKNSYQLALENKNTLQAKNSVEGMAKIYLQRNQQEMSINIYKHFLSVLDTLVKSDSSIVDAKILQATEDKITQLEKEKILQDELLKKKNRFSILLVVALISSLLLSILIFRALRAIQTKNKHIQLASLRREMNPHFIFNSLNSINQYISTNNELEANKYLTAYSTLMRKIMENSNKDFISLHVELDLLQKYLSLEKLRFPDKFDYEIDLDSGIDIDAVQVPNMLIQPQLENAIWHGLRYKDEKGKLTLSIHQNGDSIIIKIQDNGIGISNSKALKTKNQQSHQSIGINNSEERIRLLNELYDKNIALKISELQAPQQGTLVRISYKIQ
ncbi:MAG: tetratricopeptide repeat protein [Chitinophagales bacterium]|nr:tetratricopeptide repeat protein [Chitinophagales bacterium]